MTLLLSMCCICVLILTHEEELKVLAARLRADDDSLVNAFVERQLASLSL